MEIETKRLQHYVERRNFALRKYQDHIAWAQMDLKWAKKDRKHGHRADHLESLQCVAHHREKALWWYARYQKKCQQIAELEKVGDTRGLHLEDVEGYVDLCKFLSDLDVYGCSDMDFDKARCVDVLKACIVHIFPNLADDPMWWFREKILKEVNNV